MTRTPVAGTNTRVAVTVLDKLEKVLRDRVKDEVQSLIIFDDVGSRLLNQDSTRSGSTGSKAKATIR